MKRLGLPQREERFLNFSIWESNQPGWFVAEAFYRSIGHDKLTLCQVIAIIDRDSSVHVLRKVPFQNTDVDVPTVTTWSLLDIADVNGDGRNEVVLEGDAYEDHWIEVVSMEGGILKTIFSGLGYSL